MAFCGQQNNRTKLEHLPILQFDLPFLTLLGCKDRKTIIHLLELRYFSYCHLTPEVKLCTLPFGEYIQNLMSCLSTHRVSHNRNGMQKKRQNVSYFYSPWVTYDSLVDR